MTKVIAIAMVKNEEDIIAQTLAHMAKQVDEVIIADNMSTDDTREAIRFVQEDHPNILELEDEDPAYLQSQKMTCLAQIARENGADWVVPFDADEMWHAHDSTIKQYIEHLQDISDGDVYEAELHDHVVTALDNLTVEDGWKTFVHRTQYRRSLALPLPKVICRARPGLVIGMGNHDARYPAPHKQRGAGLVVCHFPYRSVDQFVSKVVNGAKAYEAAGARVPAGAGGHWKAYYDAYLRGGRDAIEEIYRTWFYTDDPKHDSINAYEICPLNLA